MGYDQNENKEEMLITFIGRPQVQNKFIRILAINVVFICLVFTINWQLCGCSLKGHLKSLQHNMPELSS